MGKNYQPQVVSRISSISSFFFWEILHNYHSFAMFDPRKMGNFITPVLLHFISDWEIKTIPTAGFL